MDRPRHTCNAEDVASASGVLGTTYEGPRAPRPPYSASWFLSFCGHALVPTEFMLVREGQPTGCRKMEKVPVSRTGLILWVKRFGSQQDPGILN